jgi:hypothetical protein
LESWGDVTIHQESGTLLGLGPINAPDFFLGDVAFSQEIATPKRLKEGKNDHECEDQTLCDLERWV